MRIRTPHAAFISEAFVHGVLHGGFIAGCRSERPSWLYGAALLVNLSLFAVVIP